MPTGHEGQSHGSAVPQPGASSRESRLTYSGDGTVPRVGETIVLMPGIRWLRMPIPGALDHINVWALEGDSGWAIVDTGLNTPDTLTAWQHVLAGSLSEKPVERLICTHMHPDHVGLAGWFTRTLSCSFWMTRLEYLTCRTLVADTGREAPDDGVRFYQAAGWDDVALETYRKRFGSFGKAIYAMPDSYRRLEDEDRIDVGLQQWHVVVGRGHSPEHACLYNEKLKVLISGDQVLPRISSNVSLFPTEPDADPLSEWLDSLEHLRATIPDDVLVLPAHGAPFRGLHARLNKLIHDHEQSLVSLRAALSGPRRAVDMFEVLFRRPIQGELLLSMATGESLAHLAWLRKRGLVVRETDASGVDWYKRTSEVS